jgi:HipA-like protein
LGCNSFSCGATIWTVSSHPDCRATIIRNYVSDSPKTLSELGERFSIARERVRQIRAFPVASVLPLTQADWKGDPVIAAFDNLLPDAEGELREKIAARVGAEGKDVFSLLSALGRDCVGAPCAREVVRCSIFTLFLRWAG